MSVYVEYNVLPYNIIYTMQTSFGQSTYTGSVTTVWSVYKSRESCSGKYFLIMVRLFVPQELCILFYVYKVPFVALLQHL